MRYVPGVDGLRALAALSVLAYHSSYGHLPGGFLGVDVFFAISGFLITTKLIEDYEESGRIHIAAFYVRRARRLLPALVLLLVLALLVWPESIGSYWASARAVLLYYANWVFLLRGPEALGPLAHAWSLSIEEQFYLLWPVGLFLLLRTAKTRRAAAIRTFGLAVVLAVTRAVAQGAGSPLAGYGSTFARADQLLLGAAFALYPMQPRVLFPQLRAWVTVGLIVPFGALLFVAQWTDPWLNYGGFTLVALLASAVVRDLVSSPGSIPSRLLSWKPLVEIGRRSYGIYLYHYPLVKLIGRIEAPGVRGFLIITALRFGATIALAWVSFRFIEAPFLRRKSARTLLPST